MKEIGCIDYEGKGQKNSRGYLCVFCMTCRKRDSLKKEGPLLLFWPVLI